VTVALVGFVVLTAGVWLRALVDFLPARALALLMLLGGLFLLVTGVMPGGA